MGTLKSPRKDSASPPGRAALFLLSTLIVGALTAPPAMAEAYGSSATVRNLFPELLTWNATVDERIGTFSYHVEARDGNGVEDLHRIVFYFISEVDGEVAGFHVDRNGTQHERVKMSWTGSVAAPDHPKGVVYRVELHLVDRMNGRTIHDRPYTTIDGVKDMLESESGQEIPDDREVTSPLKPRPFLPLTFDARVVATPWSVVAALVGVLAALSLVLLCASPSRPRGEDGVQQARRAQSRRRGPEPVRPPVGRSPAGRVDARPGPGPARTVDAPRR